MVSTELQIQKVSHCDEFSRSKINEYLKISVNKNFINNFYRSVCNVGSRSNVKKLLKDLS